ncbi:unnamed protein product [Rhizoctonia solani]|uniref:Transmembrane protein n=1 Tax=Rhizoctonia solani TaxID=456999 RepID=A0A8H2WZN5_9AGAM|nr:unnamed protein product [Rhizoctonia solani]
MDRLLSLEYKLSHPYPRGLWFLIATVVIFSVTLPLLVVINLATLGSEQVLTLQKEFQPNETLLAGWWGTGRLPSQFRPRAPECQLRDVGRGDTFRLTSSLFDYTVKSIITKPEHPGAQPEQIRLEYRGQNFSSCYVNGARYDFGGIDKTQSVTIHTFCPGFPYRLPVNVSMQTTVTFSDDLTIDFVGQYYGPGLDMLSFNDSNHLDYRVALLAALQGISTDSLTIMHSPHLSNPVGSIRIAFQVDATTGAWENTTSTLTYLNGSHVDEYPAEAKIYAPSIANLVTVVIDAVGFDLGSNMFPNVFRNTTYMSTAIGPNFAPEGINSTDWAGGSRTFYYGALPPEYQTWADALRHGYPVAVGNLTGLPEEGSTIYTTYLCPSYQVKPTGSLLSSVFIGSATMFYSAWGAWMFITGVIARRITEPRVQCLCDECRKQREEERRKAEESPMNRPVSGMIARFMMRGNRTHRAEINDEEHDSADPRASESKHRPDSLAVNNLSYTNRPKTEEK